MNNKEKNNRSVQLKDDNMCQWCISHGDGKIWYKNAKNYARSIYKRSRSERKSAGRSEADNAIMGMLRDAAKKFGTKNSIKNKYIKQ